MRTDSSITAEVNIHLRAREQDKELIDQAASLIGANRSQFMLASAIKEAKNILLDQTSFALENAQFHKVLNLLDAPASSDQIQGMKRLQKITLPWIEN